MDVSAGIIDGTILTTADPTFMDSEDFVVVPGTYSFTEDIPDGWRQVSAECTVDGGDPIDISETGEIDIGATETVVCEFVNEKFASLTIKKTTNDEIGGAFTINVSGPTTTLDGKILTTADPTFMDSATEIETETGAYTITEDIPDGWRQVSATCTVDAGDPIDISETGLINFGAMKVVVCEFVNEKFGTIKIVKTIPLDASGAFGITITGETTIDPFMLTPTVDSDDDGLFDDMSEVIEIIHGDYTVFETLPDSTWQQKSATCDDGTDLVATNGVVNVGPMDDVICTFDNENKSTLIVKKTTQDELGGNFFINVVGPTMFVGANQIPLTTADPTYMDSEELEVTAGEYVVTEEFQFNSDWRFVSLTCTDNTASQVLSTTVGEPFIIEPGHEVLCEFINQHTGRIEIEKILVGFTGDPATFVFDIDNGPDGDVSQLKVMNNPVEPSFEIFRTVGEYDVSESQILTPGWTLLSAECDNGTFDGINKVEDVEVFPGEVTKCTFVNFNDAFLTIKKTTLDDIPGIFTINA